MTFLSRRSILPRSVDTYFAVLVYDIETGDLAASRAFTDVCASSQRHVFDRREPQREGQPPL
jgi:hypothetical protein